MFKNLVFLLSILALPSFAARVVQVDELRANTGNAALLATSTQLSYLAGVTANIQTQINAVSGGGSSFNPLTTVSFYEDFLNLSSTSALPWPKANTGTGTSVDLVVPANDPEASPSIR